MKKFLAFYSFATAQADEFNEFQFKAGKLRFQRPLSRGSAWREKILVTKKLNI
jgi:hypothetical protein